MEKKKKKKNKLKTLIISDLMLLICVFLLLYPIVSDIWNQRHYSYLAGQYSDAVTKLNEEDYSELLRKAHEYNQSLVGRSDSRFTMTDEEREKYKSLLNVPGTDVMAYLDAPTIGVEKMPVYHGTSNEVLQAGVGHFEGSSLPVGGPSTHTVLSGHTGMAGLKLFSDLHSIKDGDIFQITVLGEVLTYEVDARYTVYPNEVEHLEIIEGADYCTLITCVPIGINTQRLMIRGHRVETGAEEEVQEKINSKKGNILKRIWNYLTNRFAVYELVMTAIAILLLVMFIIPDAFAIIGKIKKRRSRKKED